MKKLLFGLLLLLVIIIQSCKKDNTGSTTPIIPFIAAKIVTDSATNIQADSATIFITLTPNNDTTIIESGVCYDTTSPVNIFKSNVVNKSKSGVIKTVIKNLKSSKNYYVCGYYKNATGIVYGNIITITSAYVSPYPMELGSGEFYGVINVICSDNNNNIYAAGSGATVYDRSYVSKWDGGSWSILNPKTGYAETGSSAPIKILFVSKLNELYSAFRSSTNGVDYNVVKFDGTVWNDFALYSPSNYYVNDLCVDVANNVYAMGYDGNYSNGNYVISRWTQSKTFTQLGSFYDYPLSMCTDASNNLYVAGLMHNSNGKYYVAKWDGTTWTTLGNFNSLIHCVVIDNAGNLIVGGDFTNANGANYIAKWDGNSWSEIGTLNIPYDYYSDAVTKINIDKLGNIFATGEVKNAAGKYFVTKWNGNSWTEVAAFNDKIYTICTDNNGILYAAGKFKNSNGKYYVARCN